MSGAVMFAAPPARVHHRFNARCGAGGRSPGTMGMQQVKGFGMDLRLSRLGVDLRLPRSGVRAQLFSRRRAEEEEEEEYYEEEEEEQAPPTQSMFARMFAPKQEEEEYYEEDEEYYEEEGEYDEEGVSDGVALAAGGIGVGSSLVMYWSLWTLFQTGCGLPPGPGGALGAVEGVSYLAVLGLVAWSASTKVRTGSGLPAGPFALLGAAEGLAYLAVAAGLVVLVLQVGHFGYIPEPIPVPGGQCYGT